MTGPVTRDEASTRSRKAVASPGSAVDRQSTATAPSERSSVVSFHTTAPMRS